MSEPAVVKQEIGGENGAEPMSTEGQQELKPDVDELMRKIEEEKEKRYILTNGLSSII